MIASPVIAQDNGGRQPVTPETAARLETSAALPGAAETAPGVAFGPDGSLLASGGRGGVVLVWDTVTGERFATLPDSGGDVLLDVTSLAVHPGGVVVAAGDAGGAIRLWDLPTGEAVTDLAAGAGAVTRLAFDADGTHLAAGLEDGRVLVWDLAAGDSIATLNGSAGAVTGLAFLPGGEARQFGDGATAVLHLAASPDGAILAAALDDGTLRLWDVASGDVRAALQPPEEGSFTRVAFVLGGALLAAGTGDGSLTVWDVESGELIVLLHGHDGAVTGLDASASGDLIATSGADRAIRLWLVPPEDGDALAGDPAAGAALFVEVGCAECHASEPDASGVGPMLEVIAREAGARVSGLTAQEYLVLSITQPHTTIVNGFPTLIPEFDLTGQEVADLIAYIQTFR